MNTESSTPSLEYHCDAGREVKLHYWSRAIRVALWLLILPLVIGVSGTVIGMIRAFRELEVAGVSDPATLSTGISTSLVTTAFGLIISFAAFVFLIIALVRQTQLKRRIS